MKSSSRRILAVVATTAAIGLASSFSANAATNWGPLRASYNGSVVVAGSGKAQINSNRTHQETHFTVTDSKRDGNTVHGYRNLMFWLPNAQGELAWITKSVASTPAISNTTETWYLSKALERTSDRWRVSVKVCAQMGWPVPDKCSSSAIITESY